MAGAMLRRWIESGAVAAEDVFVVNRHDRELPAGVRQGRAFPDEPAPDFLQLGIKPYQLDEIDPLPTGDYPLLSILAGADAATLAARFPGHAIVRAMPNLPVALGKGVVAMHGRRVPGIDALMAPLGLVEWFDDEGLFDRGSVLSGCGPAFVYRFIDALAEAGTALGLTPDQAQRLAIATVEGAGLLAAQADAPPSVLADRVASPGGSTRQGLNVLDQDAALAALLRDTLAASARRTAEMAAEARR
ncbi:pyrroline-5-carboxylate reductase [Sphingomonas naasensis]|uniref:Pyrroline-5-carboxylate reductase n=1 Tax=Sphingomonas naasensis TaxID=1344951 RepID=A0A4S1WJV7_9SPHN|nr:pyrroline-5-carboxylate reductase dimerization domain-containing protein [Sphingomonas naasensis]TGX43494.1 pyrroline-5-carboxylate reductase [Sphingomonas naasensis]